MWRRKITQTEFAGRVLGITQSALSQKLRGKRPFLAEELAAVADELELDLNTLTPRRNPPPFDDGGGFSSGPTSGKSSCFKNAGHNGHLRLHPGLAA